MKLGISILSLILGDTYSLKMGIEVKTRFIVRFFFTTENNQDLQLVLSCFCSKLFDYCLINFIIPNQNFKLIRVDKR